MKKTKLMLGDNMESLKKLPDNSIDSIVSDPPYGLSFMGKKWDYDVPSVEFWKEVYRVLKPGGHILSFGGTRTYHRMVVNIEDAGFEIRDQVMWLYASGFPKSLNIEKQFDKNGYKVCECSKQNTEHNLRQMPETNISQTINSENKQRQTLLSQLPQQDIQISEHTTSNVWSGQSSVEGWNNSIQEEGKLQGNNIQESTRTSKRNGEEGWIHNGAQNDNVSNGKPIIDENRSSSSQRPQSEQQSSEQSGTMADKRRPQESGSRKICGRCGEQIVSVKGFGTALKPANEPICVARKPLSEKTIAENVIKWGTGGINIDGCRVGTELISHGTSKADIRGGSLDGSISSTRPRLQVEEVITEGRFPANIILDETAAELLDKQSGIVNQGHWPKGSTKGFGEFGGGASSYEGVGTKDKTKSGASRFFYVAKVSKKERNLGLDGFEETTTDTKGHGIDRVCMNEGCGVSMLKPELCKCNEPDWRVKPKKNNHPTLKPINLMTYLCRLVTPQGGIVLDPFMGSGSTGIAALLEGFRFVGMEMDKDYFKIAEARIEAYEEYRKLLK